MNYKRLTQIGTASVLLLIVLGCVGDKPTRTFIKPAELPSRTEFPNPLVFTDGSQVRSKAEWENKRKPELKELFQHYMYGNLPPKPEHESFQKTGEYSDFLNGKASLECVTIQTGTEANAPRIQLMIILPKNGAARHPVFLGINFCGNQAVIADPRVPLAVGWTGVKCDGCVSNRVTEAARGTQATNWNVKEIISRGYGLATFHNGDVDSDRADVSEGVYAWLASKGIGNNSPTNRGTIAAWAWGFSRCVDYLRTDPRIDSRRIAVVGHSRNGKAAIVAAAFDERIAMAFAHQAGTGGSAPSRSTVGESVRVINTKFPHWFNGAFKKFNDSPEKLPFDQNCLLALCAPRPVLFSAADEDQWANPAGQLQMLKAASPVYDFLGVKGLDSRTHLEVVPVQIGNPAGRLGFFMRHGKHSMLPEDWHAFLAFADAQWGVPAH